MWVMILDSRIRKRNSGYDFHCLLLSSQPLCLAFLSVIKIGSKMSRSCFCYWIVMCIHLNFSSPEPRCPWLRGPLGPWIHGYTGGFAQSCCSWPLLSPCPKPEDLTLKTLWDWACCDVHREWVMGLIKPTLLTLLMWELGSIYLCSLCAE